jgi:hypothetical protein
MSGYRRFNPADPVGSYLGWRMRRLLLIPAICLFGCAPAIVPVVRGKVAMVPPVRLAVFLPTDARTATPDREFSDDASAVVREGLVREFKRNGCTLADLDTLDTLVQGSLANGDLSWDEAARISQRAGADLSVVGKVTDYRRGSMLGPSTVVGIRLDVVDPDGRTSWTLVHKETAAQEDPAVLARDVALKAARALVQAWGGCPGP